MNGDKIVQYVRDFVERNFYVDDRLISVSTADDAIELVKKTQQELKEEPLDYTRSNLTAKQ